MMFKDALDYLANKLGLKSTQEPEDVWRKKYPEITKKIDDLELRLKQVEMKSKTKVIRQKEKAD